MRYRRTFMVLAYALAVAPALGEQQWVREVIDPDVGGQGLSVSAIEHNGVPAVVYRTRTGSERPRLVVSTLTNGTQWVTETISTPGGSETYFESSAVTVGGATYAAVSYSTAPSAPRNSLRVFRRDASGWNVVFDRAAVGTTYGQLVTLGTYNGRVAAVYGGNDNSASPRRGQFLYQDSAGVFREEQLPFFAQGATSDFDFTQVEDNVVITMGRSSQSQVIRRVGADEYESAALPFSSRYPSVAESEGALLIFDAVRPTNSAAGTPQLARNNGAGWKITETLDPVGRQGGADFVRRGSSLYLAHVSGPENATGTLFWSEIVNDLLQTTPLGPAVAGPDFNQVDATFAQGLPLIAIMDNTLPSGRDAVVVYRVIPEPATFFGVIAGSMLLLTRQRRRQ